MRLFTDRKSPSPPIAASASGYAAPKSNMLACCFNPRVLIGIGLAIGGVAFFAPGLLRTVVPYLLYLICPLSMVLMMFMMNRSDGMKGNAAPGSSDPEGATRLNQMQAQLHDMESRYLALKAERSGSDGAMQGSEAGVQR